MSQLQRAMQGFQGELRRRAERIRRGAYLLRVDFSPVESGSFEVTAVWKRQDGTEEKYIKIYTPEIVLASNGPSGVRLRKRACRTVDELIRDILTQRGVLP